MPGIDSRFFGVTNYESFKRPAFTQSGNGVVLNGVFYPYELKQFLGLGTPGSLGYMITVTEGTAYYIRDFWWIYNSGADIPVVQFSFYDFSVGFKRYWFLTDIIRQSLFSIQHYEVNMLMPPNMQFTQTFDNETKTVGYMEVNVYCAVVPSIVQVEGIQQGETNVEKDCLILDWISDKCYPGGINNGIT
jgi:hypothetical protein